jgi:glucosamine 6-phosphate synthetase-like amidotransferase/phosphosugar isomerase protein
MCSILGFGFQKGHSILKDEPIWEALSKLFICSQMRGRTSTGAAFVNRKDVVVVKAMMSADKFVMSEEYKAATRKYLSVIGQGNCATSPPISVIGHCRAPTKGTPHDNHNNHPIPSGSIVGVHNGGITNDEQLWSAFKLSKHRRGQVDSEIIFALIDHFAKETDNKIGYMAEAIKQASKHLQGGYACAAVNTRNPYCIWLFRNYNPCIIRHYYDTGLVVWGSVERFLESSLETSIFGPYEEIDLPQHSGIGIDLHRSQFEEFSLSEPKRSLWIA